MVSAQISSPLERFLFLCAECHPLLSHFKELTVILAHMASGAVSVSQPVSYYRCKGEMDIMSKPGTAAVLSLFIPGVGQIYNGAFWRGIFWLIITPGF